MCYRTGGSLGENGGAMTVGEVPSNRRGGSFGGWCYRRDGRFTGGETNLYNVTVFQIWCTFEKTNRNGLSQTYKSCTKLLKVTVLSVTKVVTCTIWYLLVTTCGYQQVPYSTCNDFCNRQNGYF